MEIYEVGSVPSPPTRISEYHAAFYFSKYKPAQCEQTWEDICDILLVKNWVAGNFYTVIIFKGETVYMGIFLQIVESI